METLSEATARFAEAGWAAQLTAVEGADALLECSACGGRFDAATMVVDDQFRYEGTSDPDDESILVALTAPCGDRGVYAAMFGPDMAPEDADVVRALPR
jgi:hypothetical protein